LASDFPSIPRWFATRRRLSFSLGTTVALACLPFAVMLYANLRSAIEELLPKTAPSIAAVDVLHERLGDNMQLALYISGAPLEDLHRFADAFADAARKLPEGAPRIVDYKPLELQDFFSRRALFYLSKVDLEELSDRLEARIAWEKRRANPFHLGLDDEDDPAPGFDDLEARLRKEQGTRLRTYESGYYDGADGRSIAMIFYASTGMTGYEASLAFRDRVAALGRRTLDDMGLKDVRIQFTGDIESVIQEQHSLQADIVTSTVIVLLFVFLLLWVYYRWWGALAAIGFAVAVGSLATFAISYAVIGSLNASSAFLGSIIVGNGINPGIMLMARYAEERRRGGAPWPSMATALRGTWVPTLVASSAAGIAYGALMITDFRGYRHFGFMGFVGMLLCWATSFLLAPPVALAVDARWPLRGGAGAVRTIDRLFQWVGEFATRRVGLVTLGAAAVSAVALAGIVRFAPDPIDHDTNRLRSKWASEPGGTREIDRKVDDILKRFLTPVVVMAARESDVPPLAQAYEESLKTPGEHLLGTVLTMQSLVPADQEAKLPVIERIRDQLAPAHLKRMDGKTRKLVESMRPPDDLKTFGMRDLPEDVRRQFRENDGSEGKLVLLFPKRGTKTTDGRVVTRLAREVRRVPLPPGAIAAGSYLVFADMFEAIAHDGPISTVAALVAVFLLSLALARGAMGTFAVTFSLAVGVLWTVGIPALGGMLFNFLNFIALPITFGIGVDYAANVFGRYRLEPPGPDAIVNAVRNSGAAVAVCSGTTIIGYSSLLLSRNGALFSFGALAVFGEVACLAAALFLLPAMLRARTKAGADAKAKADAA